MYLILLSIKYRSLKSNDVEQTGSSPSYNEQKGW